MFWFGLGLIAFSLLYIAMKTYVSYSSSGGQDGGVPLYDGCLAPPYVATLGICACMEAWRIRWPIWAYVLIWFVITILSFLLINFAGGPEPQYPDATDADISEPNAE
jgi:hypothetical protein